MMIIKFHFTSQYFLFHMPVERIIYEEVFTYEITRESEPKILSFE